MLRRLMDLLRPRRPDDPSVAAEPRDFVQERQDHRESQMSDEVKAWQAASQQRDRENRARDQDPPVP